MNWVNGVTAYSATHYGIYNSTASTLSDININIMDRSHQGLATSKGGKTSSSMIIPPSDKQFIELNMSFVT